jgi:hypothetical protein
VVPFDNHDIGFFRWIFDTPLNLMRNGSAAESSQMIHATQDSSRPQFWHRKKNGSREALAVYDPNISAKSIAGKVAIGSVTS